MWNRSHFNQNDNTVENISFVTYVRVRSIKNRKKNMYK